MFTKLGIASLVCGLGVWLFGVIAQLTNEEKYLDGLTLSFLLGDHTDTILDSISSPFFHDIVSSLLLDIPLGVCLLVFGGICLVISLFTKGS